MSDAYAGEIRIFPYIRQDLANWLPCDGRALSVSTYQVLFAVIGTVYGGDGRQTFNIPDFRGRVPVGQGTLVTPTGNVSFAMGQKGGEEAVTLNGAQGVAHTHMLNATTNTGNTATPGPGVMMGSNATYLHYVPIPASPSYTPLADATLTKVGGNQSHTNIMPTMGLGFFICTNGLFPQQP